MVVTGANRGVGPELVKKLMAMEMDVVAGMEPRRYFVVFHSNCFFKNE